MVLSENAFLMGFDGGPVRVWFGDLIYDADIG